MSARRVSTTFLAIAAVCAATAAAAQDLRMSAQAAGRPLPPAYERRLREDPAAFEIERGWTGKAAFARRTDGVLQGTLPLLVVQALFSDSPEPAFTPAQVQNALFDGPAPYGTLKAFYQEVSGGKLTVQGRVLPWVRTSIPRAEGVDTNTGGWLLDALAKVDAQVDFGQFDNDGPDGVPNSGDDDGLVDAVAFHFAENAASCGGNGIWPHRSRISGWTLPSGLRAEAYRSQDLRPNGEPVRVNDYITQSTIGCSGQLLTSSTISHELGHILGLPDLYHAVGGIEPQFRRWVVGCWSLMAAGAWGCGSSNGLRPPHLGPWEKSLLGWVREERVGDVVDTEVTLPPVTQGTVLRIDLSPNEYFLVEYRPKTGFDQDLLTGGVLIYRVDRGVPFFPCAACARRYGLSLVEADGNGALLKTAGEGGNRGEGGDAWGVGGRVRFAGNTTPPSRMQDGTATAVVIHDIQLTASAARIRLSTVFPRARLLKSVLQGSGEDLTAEEKALLDSTGNRNGRYDIGDLRAYLQAHPAAGQGG